MKSPFGRLDNDVKHLEAIALQNTIDNTFRLIVFIYLLSLSILHFSHEHVSIVIVTSAMIILSLIYGFFITHQVGQILTEQAEGYNSFNLVFYYIQTIFMAVLYLILIYFYYYPLKSYKKHFISTNKDDNDYYDTPI